MTNAIAQTETELQRLLTCQIGQKHMWTKRTTSFVARAVILVARNLGSSLLPREYLAQPWVKELNRQRNNVNNPVEYINGIPRRLVVTE